jgi:hypothetical protein
VPGHLRDGDRTPAQAPAPRSSWVSVTPSFSNTT